MSDFTRQLREARENGCGVLEARQSFWRREMLGLERRHRRCADGLEIAAAIADAVDTIVLDAYDDGARAGRKHALVALGGYGRREMAPRSDVDLLFLFEKERDKSADFIAGVLHPLWDVGFDLGHSSRTISETVKIARTDLASCTAMMDGRLLAGDRALYDKYQHRLFRSLPKKTVASLARLRLSRLGARGRVQVLEPNVKESAGGLREIHLLEWALKARSGNPELNGVLSQFLDREDIAALTRGRAFLWRVRHELHFTMKRKHDTLEHEGKTAIAANLGYADRSVTAGKPAESAPGSAPTAADAATGPAGAVHRVGGSDRIGTDSGLELAAEHFMRDYYLHAREVFHLVEVAFQRVTRKPRGRSRRLLLEPGVTVMDGDISLPDGAAYFREEPVRLLRIFALAQSKNMRLGEQAQRIIRQSLHLIDTDFRRSGEARALFAVMIRRRQRVAATLRLMHELGVLGAYLPEFGSLTCLVQYDIYHLYTVDEHTLIALENLEKLATSDRHRALKIVLGELARRDLLVLGILLHDVGKSRRQEHIQCGLEMTAELIDRLDMPEEERRFVLFLVENHQEMVVISQRRDLDDHGMIADFAGKFANPDWLRALYLLSYADLSAVASDAWNDWHGALLWELYHKTMEQLESGLKSLEDQQLARQQLERHLDAIGGTWPASRVKTFQQHVESLPGRYLVYDHHEIERHLELIEEFRRGDRLVEASFVAHDDHTEILLCARDQPQLLSSICGVLSVNDIDIFRADVNTRSDKIAIDVFQVTDVDGSPSLPEWKQKRVGQQLHEVASGASDVAGLFGRYSENWARRRHNSPTRAPVVEFENQVSEQFTVIDTDVRDDAGVLYAITSGLAELDLHIQMAIINTVADRARDAFYIVDNKGQKIVNYQVLETIRERLLAKLRPGDAVSG